MSYVLIDAMDDSILAHSESIEELLRIVQQARTDQPERELVFGRFDEHAGELVSTRWTVTARSLNVWEGLATFGR